MVFFIARYTASPQSGASIRGDKKTKKGSKDAAKFCKVYVMNIDTLLKQNSRSLYLSAKIMPSNIRKTFYCGYLMCRIADTVSDTTLIPSDKRIKLIKNFHEMLEKQEKQLLSNFKEAAGEASGDICPSEKILLDNIDICIKEFNTLSSAHRKLVLDVVHYVCLGMELDLSYFPEENSGLLKAVTTEGKTEEYCNFMGGEPGVFWAKLLLNGKEDTEFVENARKIGKALQITNILRDISTDVKLGRSYLPLTDLSKHDLMPQDLLDKKNHRKLRPVIYKWIDWGIENLKAAPAFLSKIPKYKFANRAAVAWPVLWSLDTFYLLAMAGNLLDGSKLQKIPRKTIYLTMLASPLYCLSDTVFRRIVEQKIKNIKRILSLI